MRLELAVLGGAAIIAGAILFIGRYQIATYGYGFMDGDNAKTDDVVYRLDRWTGEIEHCGINQNADPDWFKKPVLVASCASPFSASGPKKQQ